MLESLFKKCCRILWKHLSHQQHITWLFLLVILSQQQHSSDAKPTKWNHSIQRRFMWKQMDSTVDGFVDRVVTGARVMKSMIGEFMPPKQNPMDYLPTETTRIKYIIRNPHTKETKVIRVRPTKKVVKLMAMTPKPLMADKPKPINIINDSEHLSDKFKSMHVKEPDHMFDKYKPLYMVDPDKLRQLEKEQEMIAEGRIPITSETKPIYMSYKTEKSKDIDHNYFTADDNIVSGKIQEFSESWKPVYKVGDIPTGFTTSKPYMMSALHTSIVGELLPEPEKHVYQPLTTNEFPDEEPKKSHTYEVTEYTAEESVMQPYAHELYNPTSILSVKHKSYTTETTPNIVTQIEEDTLSKPYYTEYRSQRGFAPSIGQSYRKHTATSTTTFPPSTTTTTTTTSTSTTEEPNYPAVFLNKLRTTTEEPNYPAVFLKKLRSRLENNYKPKSQHQNRLPNIPLEDSWLPANTTFTSQKPRQVVYHQHHHTSIAAPLRIKSQKWPPDVEDTYLTSAEPLIYDVVSKTTEVPILQEFTTQSILSNSNSRKNVRLKIPHYSSFSETKHRSARHRGSVKYGDKLDIEER